MARSPETILRHELCGLHVRVVESRERSQVGIEGTVVSETTNTLVVATGAGAKRVPKAGRRFEFRLVDEAAAGGRTTSDRASAGRRSARKTAGTPSEPSACGCAAGEGEAYVTVDGETLLSRPARRSENGVDTQWR